MVRDIYKLFFGSPPKPEQVVPVSRVALFLTTILALAMTLSAESILDYIKVMISLFIIGMSVMGIIGRLWRRYNAAGAMTTLLSATATAAFIDLIPKWAKAWRQPGLDESVLPENLVSLATSISNYWGGSVIPVVLVSATAGIVVSLLTKADHTSQEEAIAILEKERNHMEGDRTVA